AVGLLSGQEFQVGLPLLQEDPPPLRPEEVTAGRGSGFAPSDQVRANTPSAARPGDSLDELAERQSRRQPRGNHLLRCAADGSGHQFRYRPSGHAAEDQWALAGLQSPIAPPQPRRLLGDSAKTSVTNSYNLYVTPRLTNSLFLEMKSSVGWTPIS